jgi:hypothetical protein
MSANDLIGARLSGKVLGSAKGSIATATTTALDFGTPNDIDLANETGYKPGDRILVVADFSTAGTTDTTGLVRLDRHPGDCGHRRDRADWRHRRPVLRGGRQGAAGPPVAASGGGPRVRHHRHDRLSGDRDRRSAGALTWPSTRTCWSSSTRA